MILTPYPVRVEFCFTPRQLAKLVREAGCPRLEWPSGETLACVHWEEVRRLRCGYSRLAIICVPWPPGRRAPTKEFLATLVHESVHVWRHVADYIGEDEPGEEVEAYTVDYIFGELYSAWEKHRKRTRKRR
jgi:hypothetical protein